MEIIDIFNFSKNNKKNEIKIRNKLLNSLLQISSIENNDNLCNLLFSNSNIFNNPYEGFISLSYSEILVNLLKFNTQKNNINYIKILTNILTNINQDEMIEIFSYLKKRVFSDYSSIDFFFSILIENFKLIKIKEQFINEKCFNIICNLTEINEIQKDLHQEYLNNEIFRKMIIKIVFLFLNLKGKYNIKYSDEFLEKIKIFLNNINSNNDGFKLLLNELFGVFFIEVYITNEGENNFSLIEKIKFIENKNELSDLEIKPLNSTLFQYLENIINLFCTFLPTLEIINEIIYYLYQIQYSYYQIYLENFRLIINNDLDRDDLKDNFVLCNFHHIFKSKIINTFFFYLIKYVQSNNKLQIFQMFPDFKKVLINVFNICPYPYYLNLFVEILIDQKKLKENDQYLNEIIEMIINMESLELKINQEKINQFEYKMQYYNIIKLLKIFFYISYYSQIDNSLCQMKIIEYFFKFRKLLKENNMIYSNYLIPLEINNEKIEKTILEICYMIIISLLSKIEMKPGKINECLEFFENRDQSSKEFGNSLFYIFDMINAGKDINDISNYQNKNFEKYLSELNYQKEEKSLLIISFIYLIILTNQARKIKNLESFIIRYKINIFNDIMILFKKMYGQFQKLKKDFIYDLILEQIYNINENKLSFDNQLMSSFEEIINKNIKKYKEIDPINDINEIYNDPFNECYLKNNCYLLKENSSILFSIMPKPSKKPSKFKDYFDINFPNNVKYFKSDLLLKDCSIFFNDLFFKDKNFDSIKKSFLIKNKNDLIGESNRKLLKYPCKLKNYSSNKYAYPKIFLKCNTNFYKDEYFSLCHPQIDLNYIKKDSFPGLPTHYDYFDDIFKKYIYNNTFALNCELISPKNIVFGKIYVCDEFILFKNGNNFDTQNLLYIFHSYINEITFNKKIIIMQYKDIEEIITRTFLYNYQAFEIFMKNGKSYMFNVYNEEYLNKFFNKIKNIQLNTLYDFIITEDLKSEFEKKGYTKKWENNEISTYQYLLFINKYSGRTFNDLNQYPIFPWIFLTEKEEKKNIILNIRDMKYFLMTQDENGKEKAKEEYKNSLRDGKNLHHFLIHYSTAGYVLFYLLRISPFTEGNIRLQSGEFDNPDRLMSSFKDILKALIKCRDNRELIPELFTSFENLFNLNYIYFGKNIKNKIVHNTIVPQIFNTPEEYIYFNRLILNNQSGDKDKNKAKLLPKCEINKWIDLVFGVNQYPGELEKLNKFDNYSYRQIKSLKKFLERYKKKKCNDEEIFNLMKYKIEKILNFGQCPDQIFNKPHNAINIKDKNETKILYFKKLDFVKINIKVITFWLNENKNFFFLIKYKQTKNISVLVYDEKLNKKYEIFIDKIKLFSCEHDFFTKDINISNNKNNDLNCSIAMDLLSNANLFNSFLVFDEDIQNNINNENNNDNYTLKDLCEIYALDPKYSMFDICDDVNLYLFVGRNYDNSIKIYSQNKNKNQLYGHLKTDSFVSVINRIDKEYFLTGHYNGKLLKWIIVYNEIENKQNNEKRLKIINRIYIERELFAHNYMIACINYNERHNIVITSDIKGFLYIRKYYDFELINKIVIDNNDICFINKIFINDYDIICTINYNIYKKKNYISFYSINGIFLEKSKNIIIIDTFFLKNGKLFFNCLNDSNLFIFGFNDKDTEDNTGKIIENNILKDYEIKKSDFDFIKNFIIDNNDIYILLKNGIFFKENYKKLDLTFGV